MSHLAACSQGKRVLAAAGGEPTLPNRAPIAWTYSGLDSIDDITSISVRLNWSVLSSAAYYVVYRVVGSDLRVEHVAMNPVSSFTVTGLSPDTAYTFRVRAADASGVIDDNARDLTASTLAAPVPTVSSVDPGESVAPGGITVKILGAGFQEGAVASIGGSPCAPTLFVSSTELSCRVPARSSDDDLVRVPVSVVNPDAQQGLWDQGFLYLGSPLLWLDASRSASVITRGATSRVVQWSDLSGQGNNAVNDLNDSTQPLFHATGSAHFLNGRRTISFDRAESTRLRVMPIGRLATALSSPFTIFTVSKLASQPLGQGSEAYSADFARGGDATQLFATHADGTLDFALWNTVPALFRAASDVGAITQGRAHLKTMTFDGGATNQIRGFVDGVEAAQSGVTVIGSVADNTGAVPYYIGAGNPEQAGQNWYFTGDIAEIVFMPGNLGETERALVEETLRNKWDL